MRRSEAAVGGAIRLSTVTVHDPVVRSGQVRGPERSPCVRMAGGEAVTRGQRAAGKS